MTGHSSKFDAIGMVAVAVAVLAAVGGACPCDEEYVFPLLARFAPAINEIPYHYVSAAVSAAGLGGLEPEWDESNSTYYVRFTGDSSRAGAQYFAPRGALIRPLLLNCSVNILNAETGRALQWRKEGGGEYFLIEQEDSTLSEAALFRFQQAEGIRLASPMLCLTRPWPPYICHGYYLVSDPDPSSGYVDAGLLAYAEEDVTYIKAAPAGSVGDLPIFLSFPSTTPEPAILNHHTHHLS